MSVDVLDPSSALSLDEGATMADLVYLQEHKWEPWIRVGWTGDDDGGRENKQSDCTPVAVMRGSYYDEKAIHEHFTYALADGADGRSTYEGDEVHEYVAWLLARGFAGRTREEAIGLPYYGWSVFNPAHVAWADRDGQLSLLSMLPPRDKIHAARADLVYLSSDSDEWYTPGDAIEPARRAMGSIDLDPAASGTRARTTAWTAHSRGSGTSGSILPTGGVTSPLAPSLAASSRRCEPRRRPDTGRRNREGRTMTARTAVASVLFAAAVALWAAAMYLLGDI